mgnify:CR=1 FL=1|jgi:hypothetical protein
MPVNVSVVMLWSVRSGSVTDRTRRLWPRTASSRIALHSCLFLLLPGAMRFTRIPDRTISLHRAVVKPITPAFAAKMVSASMKLI